MKLYDKLDEEIMKGVNAGVRAWNWTTGRTRGDLANLLEFSGSAFICAASLPRNYMLLPFVSISTTILAYFTNKHIDKIEHEAMEKQCLDPFVESSKESLYKSTAPSTSLFGACIIGLPTAKDKEHSYLLGIGTSMWGAGLYVMRADYLPPRKNVLSRAADKIKEWAKEFEERPIGVPAPAYSKSLEEQLT